MPDLSRSLEWRGTACPALLAAVLLACGGAAQAGAFAQGAHGSATLLPRACGSCHVGHGPPRSLMLPSGADGTCLQCHGDAAARDAAKAKGLLTQTEGLGNVSAEFLKISHHPLGNSTQSLLRIPVKRVAGGAPAALSTVACVDCHDEHYQTKAANGGQLDVTKIKQIGNSRHGDRPEYELCYKCHGTGAASAGRVDIQRLVNPGNASYHPVQAIGKNPSTPSLIQPYTTQSYTACTDCHGSDQANAPRGPHGSLFRPILKANYSTQDGQAESLNQYALCYRCHNRATVNSESQSSFRYHKKHLEKRASCRACHNSHGSTQYAHLIDFDTTIVTPNTNNQLDYQSSAGNHGSCNLRCHGKNHVNLGY